MNALSTRLRILIAEDSPDDAQLMLMELSRCGIELDSTVVDNVADMRSALAQGGWDIVLSDYSMPQFGAADALALCREVDPDLPFVVVSGTIGEERAVELMRAGASDYLLKGGLARLVPVVERVLDESTRRRTQRQTEQAAARLAAIVESSEDAIISETLDGVVTSWNQAAERLFGWPAAEAIGRSIASIVPLDKADELAELMARMGQGEHFEQLETIRLHRDGTRLAVSITLSPIRGPGLRLDGFSKIVRDLAARGQAEKALRQSDRQLHDQTRILRLLLDNMGDGVIVADDAGKFLLWNPAAQQLMGLGPTSVARSDWAKRYCIYLPDGETLYPAADLPLAKALRGESSDDVEMIVNHERFPERRWLSVNGRPMWDEAGIPVGGLIVFRNITEKKQAEQLLATQHAVVSILAEAPNLEEAAPRLLRAVCETARWDVGVLWVVDQQMKVLSFVNCWHDAAVPLDDFCAHTRRLTFAVGECLPGRAWSAAEASWIVDPAHDPHFIRVDEAAKAGLNSGFAFPIRFEDEILGVAEFFDRNNRPPNAELLRLVASLGSQIGQFIQRKRVEEGLRLFRALIDKTTDGIEVVDPETGRFLDVNETSCLAHGYTREEYLSLSVLDVNPGIQSWPEASAARESGELRVFESQHRRKNGSTFPVEVSLNTISLERAYIVAVVRDISERIRLEDAARLRNRALAVMTQGLVITDAGAPDNPIVFVNPGFERLTGYDAEEILGRNCRFLQGKDTDPTAIERMRRAIVAAEFFSLEVLNYRKDGTPFWNELSISPIRDAAGELTHFVGVEVDVTARRKLEEQLHQAQKMEAFGQLAGGVAHDFNNLLTVINGYSEILLQTLLPADPTRAMVSEIQSAGERSASLTRQLLAFSRQQVLAPRILNMNEVVGETDKMLRRLIGEDVTLTTTLVSRPWAIRADPGQVEQVLLNLAVNARDAMPQGGRLTIETQNVVLDEAYLRSHAEAQTGSYVLLSVTDTGSGMGPAVKARIFEPFYTTKAPGKGTGLGLATVYGIVKQSRGLLDVYSEIGVGTTFKMYLPRIEDATTGLLAPIQIQAAPRGTETVLLAEDEAAVRNLTRRILVGYGYTVLLAANGAEALAVAGGHAGPIHLLLTDVVMPGAGGRMVAEQVRVLHSEVRVLFMSGYTDDAVIRHGVLSDGMDFLQKPFTPVALAFKVREVLDARAPGPTPSALKETT